MLYIKNKGGFIIKYIITPLLLFTLISGFGSLISFKSNNIINEATNNISTQEIQVFNAMFTTYEGQQKGSSVKSLLSTVTANNETYANDTTRQVKIDFSSMSEDILQKMNTTNFITSDTSILIKLRSELNTTATYSVIFSEYNNGLISTIKITK